MAKAAIPLWQRSCSYAHLIRCSDHRGMAGVSQNHSQFWWFRSFRIFILNTLVSDDFSPGCCKTPWEPLLRMSDQELFSAPRCPSSTSSSSSSSLSSSSTSLLPSSSSPSKSRARRSCKTGKLTKTRNLASTSQFRCHWQLSSLYFMIFPGYSLKFNIFVSPLYKKSLQKGGTLGALHAQREGQLQVQAVEGGRLLPLWVLHHDPHRPQHNTSHDEGQLLLLFLNIEHIYQLVFLQWTREVVRKNMGIIWGFFSNGRSNNLFFWRLS